MRAGRAAGRGPHAHSGNSCAVRQAAVPSACPPCRCPTLRPLVVAPWSLLLTTPLCGPQTEPWLLAPTAGVGRLSEDTLEEGESAASCVWGARRHRQHGSPWPQRRVGRGLGGRQGPGGWWEGAVPFCSAPRHRRWVPSRSGMRPRALWDQGGAQRLLPGVVRGLCGGGSVWEAGIGAAGRGRRSPWATSLLESVLKLPCDALPGGIPQRPRPRPGRWGSSNVVWEGKGRGAGVKHRACSSPSWR